MRGFTDEDDDRRHRDEDDEAREPVTFDNVYADRETLLALLCVLPQGKRTIEKWIPKSQIHDDSEVYRAGDKGKLVLMGWFAEKEGLQP